MNRGQDVPMEDEDLGFIESLLEANNGLDSGYGNNRIYNL